MNKRIERYSIITEHIWHFRVDDNLPWKFCAGVWNQDTNESLSSEQIKKAFLGYFKYSCGIEPYSKCPKCGKELVPRESRYGKFVGCSAFPVCDFIATKTKPYECDTE